MSLDHNLRQALQEEAEDWSAPPELKGKILSGIVPGQGGRRMKKWFAATILAAALLIPTGAYAGYSYLADSMYGSQDNLVQVGGTQEEYDHLEAKLQQAKASFSEKDFAVLTSLLQELGGYNLKMADADGVLHPGQLSDAEQKSYKELTTQLEPYFKQLNEAKAPGTVASAADTSDFWDRLLVKAEQSYSGEELAGIGQWIGELKAFDATTADPSNRLTEAEVAQYKQLLEQLNPYLKKLGVKLEPGS